jgi:probable phosphoglycerate mutase
VAPTYAERGGSGRNITPGDHSWTAICPSRGLRGRSALAVNAMAASILSCRSGRRCFAQHSARRHPELDLSTNIEREIGWSTCAEVNGPRFDTTTAERARNEYDCRMRTSSGTTGWPSRFWLARHGESAGNVARLAAEAAGQGLIDIAARDVDVPLSGLGERQAAALGRWFRALPKKERPTIVFTSPYRRAVETAAHVAKVARLELGSPVPLIDERLREKELGILNRLTRDGVLARHPDQAALRAELGKFYYRPPSGESWCDVILRLRSFVAELQLQHAGERVLVVAHQVVVLCFRYLLEGMTEGEILEVDRQGDVANCSLSAYESSPEGTGASGKSLRFYNFVAPIEAAGEPVTSAPDAPVAVR